jgi:hypothetical protein
LPFAAYAAAALSLFPKSKAQDSIAARSLGEPLDENLREVLNVLSRLLNLPGEEHFRLRRVIRQEGRLPAEIPVGTGGLVNRLDFEIGIDGYGEGRMTIVELSR